MSEIRIAIPDLDLNNALRLDGNLRNYEIGPFDDVVLDFSRMTNFDPLPMLMAGAIIKRFRYQYHDNTFSISGINGKSYAGTMGFFKYISESISVGKSPGEATGSSNYIPITPISIRSLQERAFRDGGSIEIGDMIERASARLSHVIDRGNKELHKLLTYLVREILRNTPEHAQADEMWICGQYWPTYQLAEIAIIDEGIGVFQSITRNAAHAKYFDAEKITPPYNSRFPEIPSDEEIKTYKLDYNSESFRDYHWSQLAILNSMKVEYSRSGQPGGYGDFGRYTFQSYFYTWKQLHPIDLKNIAIKRIFELGYDVEKHGKYDRNCTDRVGLRFQLGRKERIGKKYQWIALYELAAQVCDNYQMTVYDNDIGEYYWSDAHTFFNNPYYCGLEWVNIDSDHLNCVFPEKVLIPVKQYYSERKGELNSLNSEIASIYWHKPCEEMYTKLQLKYLKGSNSAFVDGAGELVCFESSELIGNDTGFYIRYDKLLEFLKSSSYTLVWTSLCEKRILTPSFGKWDLPPKAIHMSSVYYLKDGKIAKASETLFEDRLYY